MSIMIGRDMKPVVRKGTAVKLPKPLQEQVEKAFDAQAQKKFWENEFEVSRNELVISLDNEGHFDNTTSVVTSRGSVNIQQRNNNEADLDKISEALTAGRMTTEQLLRCVKKLDLDMVDALLGHGYVKINPPTKFVVLRPGAGVVEEKLKVAK